MRPLLPVVLLAALALAGCADDAPDAGDDAGTGSSTPSTTGAPMPTGAPPPPVTHESIMRNNLFVPADFTVKVGDTVHWVTEDVQAHNVVSENAADPFRSEDVSILPVPPGTGTEYSHTFSVAGSIDYVCEYHSGMVGTVTVLNQTA